MKLLMTLLILSFAFVGCTSSSDPASPAPSAIGQGTNPPAPPSEVQAKLSKMLSLSFSQWKNNFENWQNNKSTPEEMKIANDYLLGSALRSIQEIESPEMLLLVRADFKNRQGTQPEADFLPLAKKILEKN